MDGSKNRLNRSVQFRLSVTLASAIVVVAILAGILSYLTAFDEAHELQDDTLRQVAQLLDHEQLSRTGPKSFPYDNEGDEEQRVFVQYLVRPDISATGSDVARILDLPATLPDGLQTLVSNGEAYRVMVRQTLAGARVAVAQELRFRDEIARDGALRSVTPLLILVPILLLLVAYLVPRMFLPIVTLSRQIDGRTEDDLHPVETGELPEEVRPFVVAINRLLGRVHQSMDAQRRFVADAAHELRSPLTALSLQAEALQNASMPAPAKQRLAELRRGITRSRNLIDQLLALARAQTVIDPASAKVSIQKVYRQVVEDLMPLAEARHIDVGVTTQQDALVRASAIDMVAIVRNLVDNAIRYSHECGQVDLSLHVTDGRAEIRIVDHGPGIPASERPRVFDPFYRILGGEQTGSGLGLSIVQTIARRIGGEIELDFANEENQSGLRASVFILVAEIPNRRLAT